MAVNWRSLPGVWQKCECVQDESNSWWRCPEHGGPGKRGWSYEKAMITEKQANSPAARAWEVTARQRQTLAEQEALADHELFIPMWLDPETPSREDKQMEEDPTTADIVLRVEDGKVWIQAESLIECLDLSYDLQMGNPDRQGTWREGALGTLSHVTGNIRYLNRSGLAKAEQS